VPLDELLAADSALLEGLLAAYREANADALQVKSLLNYGPH
jgi:hypothetical protein